jgi:hypothetical protein
MLFFCLLRNGVLSTISGGDVPAISRSIAAHEVAHPPMIAPSYSLILISVFKVRGYVSFFFQPGLIHPTP